jgi:hypothetical protein
MWKLVDKLIGVDGYTSIIIKYWIVTIIDPYYTMTYLLWNDL